MAFVERCLNEYCARMEKLFSTAPDDIRAELMQEIRRDESLVSDDDLRSLLRDVKVGLPRAFLAYVKAGLSQGIERDEYTLPGVPEEAPLKLITTYLFEGSLRPAGYLQFAAGPCGDPVCFDIGAGEDDVCRVVCFNHDAVPHKAWSRRETLQAYADEIAPSFAAYLEWLCRPAGESQ